MTLDRMWGAPPDFIQTAGGEILCAGVCASMEASSQTPPTSMASCERGTPSMEPDEVGGFRRAGHWAPGAATELFGQRGGERSCLGGQSRWERPPKAHVLGQAVGGSLR